MPTTTRDTGLTPAHIVDVARRLISEHGLDWFSMRKLAAELDVNPMTVYLRFENKDDLLDAVARRALQEVRLPDPPDGPWAERAAALCIALRSHLLADRNLLELFATADRLSGAVVQAVEQGLSLMEELGLEGDDAVQGFRTLFWHTVGFTLVHHRFDSFPADSPGGLQGSIGAIDAETHPAFARHLPSFTSVDGDALFAHTTRLLVAGMHRAATSSQGAP